VRELTSALVLGGAGFLGSWIVDALADDGVDVVIVDNLTTGRVEHTGTAPLSIADAGSEVLRGILGSRHFDAVFHVAGPAYVPTSVDRPGEDLAGTVGVTLAVLEEIRALERRPLVVYASSAAVYGESRYLPIDEDHPLLPLSPYGVSKLAAEHYIRIYASLHGVPAMSLRPFSLYGPRQRKQVVHDLLVRALQPGEVLTVAGVPEVSRDLVYVADAARAFVTLARRGAGQGETYNIATGQATTLAELAAAVVTAAGAAKRVRFTGGARPGDPTTWCGDASRARALGVELPTELEDGLRRTAAWLVAEGTAD